MDLPTEIVDYILSFLQSDLISLKTCSQSHPILSQLVERYLYTNITITDADNDPAVRVANEYCLGAQELAKILANKPHIAKHVRHLYINSGNYSGSRKTDCLNTTSLFLPLLSSLRKLTISYARSKFRAQWPNIQKDVRSVLLDHLCLPSLEEVHLENLVLDFALLKRCTESIRFLTLRQCYLRSSKGAPTRDELLCPPLLRSLSIDNCDIAFLYRSLAWIQAHPLHSLRLNSLYDNFKELFTQVLSSCLSSLTILDLNFEDDHSTVYIFHMTSVEEEHHTIFPFVNLTLPCLERLTLRTKLVLRVLHIQRGVWTLSAPLPAMLQLIKSSRSLKRLYLDFQYGLWHSPFTQNRQVPDADCVWFPLLSIAAASVSLSVDKICVFVRGNLKLRQSDISSPASIFSSVADCQRLMRYVDQGLVVIRGDVSCGDGYEEDSTFTFSL